MASQPATMACLGDALCRCRRCKPPLSPIAQEEQDERHAAMVAAAAFAIGSASIVGATAGVMFWIAR